MSNSIMSFSDRLLSAEEIAVANRIEWLIKRKKYKKAKSLIQEIFPKYCDDRGGIPYTLWPSAIYRPLYYLNIPSFFTTTSSSTVHMMGEHLEGLLKWLPEANKKLALGAQIKLLKGKILPINLADNLLEFNNIFCFVD